jgi:hypothetical protein
MINIDYALRVYTDILNSNEKVDLEFFKSNLSADDYKEFVEIIQFIKLFKSAKATKKFEEVFEKVNARKEELYSFQTAANFRTEKNADDKKAKNIIDKIFDEEFSDD